VFGILFRIIFSSQYTLYVVLFQTTENVENMQLSKQATSL